MTDKRCELKAAGKPYPRTCPVCGLGQCLKMVPPAGVEPAPRERTDFESVASTNSAKEAYPVGEGVSSMDAADTDWQMGSGQYHGTRYPRKGHLQLHLLSAEFWATPASVRTFRDRLWYISEAVTLPFNWKASFYYDTRGYWYFQVEDTKAICNVTGETYPWKGRKWLISEHMTDGEIVQTMFKATMTAIEHEVREQFLYKDVAVFDPHYDLDKLADLRKRKDALKTRDSTT